MKKVLLFFVMVLLVLVSARSLLSCSGCRGCHQSWYEREAKELSRVHRVARQEYIYLKNDLDRMVAQNIDESSLRLIVRLLGVELDVVKSLLNSKTGQDIDKFLMKRKKLLRASTKTVSIVYTAIMNFATSDLLITGRKGARSDVPLRGWRKKNYLKRVQKVLKSYHKDFSDKQYYLSQRTLGLPTRQYHPYVARHGGAYPRNICTNINVKDNLLYKSDFPRKEKSFKSFCPLGQNREAEYRPRKNYHRREGDISSVQSSWQGELNEGVRGFGARFAGARDKFIDRMRSPEVVGLIDDVLTLVKNEIQNHVGSLKERSKMFCGTKNLQNICTNIEILEDEDITVSREAKIVFNALRETAISNTMSLGWWNPDVYEKNLQQYITRLENIRSQSNFMINGFKNDVQRKVSHSCTQLKKSLENLLGGFVYSLLPARS